MQPSKDFEIDGVRFQVGKLRARDGSWVLAQVATKMLPAALEAALKQEAGGGKAMAAFTAAAPGGRAMLSEEEFFNLQGHALAVCRRYENGLPMPIFVRPNTFVAKELEYDLMTVMALTINSLVFNLAPFFQGDALGRLMASLGLKKPEADPDPNSSIIQP